MSDEFRRDDDDGARALYFAHQEMLDGARAGREIDDEIGEIRPPNVMYQLLRDEACGHRVDAQWLILTEDESGRSDRNVVPYDWHELLRGARGEDPAARPSLMLDVQHHRYVRSVEVEIQDAYASVRSQRAREVERYGRLSDATLAGADRNDATFHCDIVGVLS